MANSAQAYAQANLQQCNSYFNNATMTLYSGTMPASPETALAGNTALATFTFSPTAFTTVTFSNGYMAAVANFVSTSVVPINNGVATFARVTAAISAWAQNTPYVQYQLVSANNNLYQCIKPGTSAASGTGPNAGTLAISDGTVIWNYIGAATATVVIDYTVGTTNAYDVVIGNVTIQTSINVTLQSGRSTTPAA